MPGDILIVDSVATNRIVLKVKLLAAQHRVRLCDSLDCARQEIAARLPDLVLLDVSARTEDALDFCRDIKASPDGDLLPIIATGGFLAAQDRVRSLRAGADDVLTRPLNDQILQARIRSLLRARDASQELRLREDTRQALGFAEPAQAFAAPARVQLVSHDPVFLHRNRATLAALPDIRIESGTYDGPRSMAGGGHIDLFIIDGRDQGQDEKTLFRLLSELRSHSASRHSAILLVLPAEASAVAAMALDLGANDVVTSGLVPEEIVLRAATLIKDKQRADQLRQTVQSGLEAAITDPLTGLYNRRYALPHLQKLAARSLDTGRNFAVMVLDIDHFKQINDTHGHAVGDEVLVQVAERLRSNMRAMDLLARIGGEEFLIAVPDSDATHARIAAERICTLIASRPFQVGPKRQDIQVTASIGVSLSSHVHDQPGVTPDALVRDADMALYRAKDSGRNTVSLFAA